MADHLYDRIHIPQANLILRKVDIHLLHDLIHHILPQQIILQQRIAQEVKHHNALDMLMVTPKKLSWLKLMLN